MEYNIITILEKLGLMKDDIKILLENNPGLMIVDTKRAARNIQVMLEAGFKKSDLAEFTSWSASYLYHDPKELAETLKGLGDNPAQKLMSNPNLI